MASRSAATGGIAEVKQRWSVIGWVTKIYYLELLRASKGTLSLCPSSGDLNRSMMMMMIKITKRRPRHTPESLTVIEVVTNRCRYDV
jgi:hypothetical protein